MGSLLAWVPLRTLLVSSGVALVLSGPTGDAAGHHIVAQHIDAQHMALYQRSNRDGPTVHGVAAQSDVRGASQVAIHVPPVDAPISDPYRAPEHDFGPGNRGIEYDTMPGNAVTASAAGTVRFAGSVAGSLFVTVDHGGGLITTVGFLDGVTVSQGETVNQGDRLGISGEETHFSARQDGVYFDPERLFGIQRVSVRLVPGPG